MPRSVSSAFPNRVARSRTIIAIVAVVALSATGTAPAFASAQGTLAVTGVSAPTRDAATGYLKYNFTASASDYWNTGDVCEFPGHACLIGLQLQSAIDGSLNDLGRVAIQYPNPTVSQAFTGSIDTNRVSAVRAYITGSGGTIFSA